MCIIQLIGWFLSISIAGDSGWSGSDSSLLWIDCAVLPAGGMLFFIDVDRLSGSSGWWYVYPVVSE
jgi:hypothetical protein